MAQRRMFSRKITESDQFLDMPMSSQSLYFHINMQADDDGFVGNVKTIKRMIGASDDDLKLLISKRFLIPFDTGIVVIRDWKIHNYIQKDRYTETFYKHEKAMLETTDNKQYQVMDTKCIQDVSSMDTQVRLGKDRLGKDRLEIELEIDKEQTSNKLPEKDLKSDFESIWKEYPNKKGKAKAFTAYKKAIKDGVDNQTIIDGISAYKKEIEIKRTEPEYIAHGSTWFSQQRWEDDYQTKGKVINSKFAQEAPTTADNIEVSDEEERMYQEYLRKQGET